MQLIYNPIQVVLVALLAEGVDRNAISVVIAAINAEVALLAEGVDRNDAVKLTRVGTAGRPPRGGRG